MIALFFSLSLAVGAPTDVNAEAGATALQEFLQGAEQVNVDRRLSAVQVQRAAAEFRQAWSAFLPSLTASGSWTYNQYDAKISAPTATGVQTITIIPKNQYDGSLRFELPLLDAARWVRAASIGASEDAAAARDALTVDLVRRNVATAYYGYVASLAVRQSAERSLGVAKEQLRLIEARKSVGSGTELDVLRARAEVERNKQMITDASVVVATSARALETLSGRHPADRIGLPSDNVQPEPGLPELEKNLDALPAMRAAAFDLRASNRLSTAAKLALLPTVSAQFTERFTNATGFQGANNLYNTGLVLTWRLDMTSVFAMQAVGAAAEGAALQAEKTRLASRDQLNSDWLRFNAALEKISAAETQVRAADRAAQVARDRYAVGATTQIELIQAERDLLAAEVGQIQARTDLALARFSLRLSAGRSID